MIQRCTQSENETIALAEAVAKYLRSGDVLALIGPLGSGKTRFVRGLVRGLGLDENTVSSPTFLICQEYRTTIAKTTNDKTLSLAHIDAYRLHSADELDTIGWDELLTQKDMIMAVEWADRIEQDLPPQHIRIEFEHLSPTQRRITIDDRNNNNDNRFANLATIESSSTQANQCPICAASIQSTIDTFPFCSQRCKLADLGKWFSGTRIISRAMREDDFDQLQ